MPQRVSSAQQMCTRHAAENAPYNVQCHATLVLTGVSEHVDSYAGGVGLAAIQHLAALNQPADAIIGTAGSTVKRGLLRSLGLQHVVSSRDIAFASVCAATGSSPDIVLNTLTSPGMLAASLASLACGGSVVELSKRCDFVLGKPYVYALNSTAELLSQHHTPCSTAG